MALYGFLNCSLCHSAPDNHLYKKSLRKLKGTLKPRGRDTRQAKQVSAGASRAEKSSWWRTGTAVNNVNATPEGALQNAFFETGEEGTH